MAKGYISTKQAALLSGYTKDYVGQLARDGHIDSIKEGRARLVKVTDLFEYISQKENEKNKSQVTNSSNALNSQTVVTDVVGDPIVAVQNNDAINIKTWPVASPVVSEDRPFNHPIIAADAAVDVESTADAGVTKKIISPWMSRSATEDTDQLVKTSQSASGASAKAKKSQPTYSNKSYSTKSVKHKDAFINPQTVSKKLLQNKSVGPKLQLLPMISTTAVVLAAMSFMFAAGTLISHSDFKTSESQVAAAVESYLLEEVAIGWYKIVTEMF